MPRVAQVGEIIEKSYLSSLLEHPDIVKLNHPGQKACFLHERHKIPAVVLYSGSPPVCCKSMFYRWLKKPLNSNGTRGTPGKAGPNVNVPKEIMDKVWADLSERTRKGEPRSAAILNRVLNDFFGKSQIGSCFSLIYAYDS
jgi:hypothetical protein